MSRGIENIIINRTCGGDCSNCGECCADILPIDNGEIKRIKNYIKIHNIKECKHLCALNKMKIDLTCPFRDNINKKCTIYEVRPAICKCFICSKPQPDIEKDKMLFHKQKTAHSMRNLFFDGPSANEIRLEILKSLTKSFNKEKNND